MARALVSRALPLAIIITLMLVYFWYPATYAVNVPFWDEWQLVEQLRHLTEGTLPVVELLKARRNEHLVGVSFAIMMTQHLLTGFSTKAMLYTSALLQVLSLALLLRLAWPLLPHGRGRLWAAVPIALLMFSLSQQRNLLWAFQTAWYLVTFFLLLALTLLDRAFGMRASGRGDVVIAALCAGLASFSSFQGLVVWVAGAAFIAARLDWTVRAAWRDRRLHIWIVAAGLCGFAYVWLSADRPGAASPDQSTLLFLLKNAETSVTVGLTALGTVFGTLGSRAGMIGGAIVLANATIALSAIILSSRRRELALPVALMTFGLVFVALVAVGRAALGTDAGRESRYAAYVIPLMVGIYLTMLRADRHPGPRTPAWTATRAAFVAVTVSSVWLSAASALVAGRQWRVERGVAALTLANYRNEAAFKLERLLHPDAELVVVNADYLRAQTMSTFQLAPADFPSEVRAYQTMPATLAELLGDPADRAAIVRLWDVFLVAEDLREAFDPSSSRFAFDLVRWASGAAGDGHHYMSPHLAPFSTVYVRIRERLERGSSASAR